MGTRTHNPDAWKDHVVVQVHMLFDEAGIPDKDDEVVGLLARAQWVLDRIAELEAQLR